MSILENILCEEITVLTSLYGCQKKMYEAVLCRDWVQLQIHTAKKDTLLAEFELLEKNRQAIVDSISPDNQTVDSFYAITVSFPESVRTKINGYFRDVRRILVLVKTENDILASYTDNARTVLTGMMNELIPAKKNRIYSKKGSLVSRNVDSLVLNRTF